MITLDTNVWVRYVTNDDQLQAARALKLLEKADAVYLPKTVLLELEWVLRAVYELEPAAIRRALLHILGLPIVTAEAPLQIAAALEYYQQGFDFADALHLASGEATQMLYTFDAKFARKGQYATPVVKTVPVK
jgi:predicted nucleic-acid-binding protein